MSRLRTALVACLFVLLTARAANTTPADAAVIEVYPNTNHIGNAGE